MPRKSRKKAIKDIIEKHIAETTPEHQDQAPDSRQERSHADQLGPRKRQPGEPGAIYDGPNIRITMDADTFMIDAKKPLTTAQQDRIVAAGFDDISEAQDGSLWLATKGKVKETGADINVLAVVLDGKGERLGRSR